jgi:lambda family phage portal protein
MAAQPAAPFRGSVILTEFAARQKHEREARTRRELAAQQQKSFAAAQLNRLTSSWRVTAERIDDELRSDLDALRQRSRSLENNNDYARNYLDIVETNIIGDSAPRLVSLADNAPGNPDAGARAAILSSWAAWGARGVCEVSGQYSFTGVCQAIARATARDGEAAVIMHRNADNDWGFALQIVDVDRLATWYNVAASEDTNAIAAGVEINSYGKPVAYHFTVGNAVSGASSRSTTRIEAGTLLHRFVMQRPEQKRGIPWMHASMLSMHYAGEFALSALMAAKHGADHMGFFVTPDGEPPNLGDNASAEPGAKIMTTAPGTYDTLPVGVDIRQIDSKYPNEVFGPFIKSAHQRMASGLPGASYPELCNDYEAVNFSSIRAAIISTRDEWKKRHKWFAEAWLEPIFAEWLRLALAKGAITLANGSPLPIAKAAKFAAHAWQFRGWSWVDPLKDIQTAKEAIDLKVTSRTRIASDMGRDIEEIFDELQSEEALASKYGIDLAVQPTTQPSPQPAPVIDPVDPENMRSTRMNDDLAHALRAIADRPDPKVELGKMFEGAVLNITRTENIQPPVIENNITVSPTPINNVIEVNPTPVNVEAQFEATIQPAEVTLNLPPRRTDGTVMRNEKGEIVSTITVERDA